MSTCSAVGRAKWGRHRLRRHAPKAGHAFPVVFVLEPAVQADLVRPVTLGISNRESELMLASKKQSQQRGQHINSVPERCIDLWAKEAPNFSNCNGKSLRLGRIPKLEEPLLPPMNSGTRVDGVQIISAGW